MVPQKTKEQREAVIASGGVPVGIGRNTHIKRAIIDKNAHIGDNVKVYPLNVSMFHVSDDLAL